MNDRDLGAPLLTTSVLFLLGLSGQLSEMECNTYYRKMRRMMWPEKLIPLLEKVLLESFSPKLKSKLMRCCHLSYNLQEVRTCFLIVLKIL